jgi:hypothetical protein
MSTLPNEQRTAIELTRQLVVANGETALLRVGRHLELSVDDASDAGAERKIPKLAFKFS